MKCQCQGESLSTWTPWVSAPSQMHTAARCGPFVRVEVEPSQKNPVTPPALTVFWPDSGETGQRIEGSL